MSGEAIARPCPHPSRCSSEGCAAICDEPVTSRYSSVGQEVASLRVRVDQAERERDEAVVTLTTELGDVRTALAERDVPRADGVDGPLYSEAHRVRRLGERAEQAERELAACREALREIQQDAASIIAGGSLDQRVIGIASRSRASLGGMADDGPEETTT